MFIVFLKKVIDIISGFEKNIIFRFIMGIIESLIYIWMFFLMLKSLFFMPFYIIIKDYRIYYILILLFINLTISNELNQISYCRNKLNYSTIFVLSFFLILLIVILCVKLNTIWKHVIWEEEMIKCIINIEVIYIWNQEYL